MAELKFQRGRLRGEWHSFRRVRKPLSVGKVFYCAYVGLGSSLGNRAQNLANALEQMDHPNQGTYLQAVSPIYETPHLGLEPGDETRNPPHLNCVAQLTTSLTPPELLTCVQEIETQGGRRRDVRWGPRTIDIDILLYDDLVMQTDELTLPHPGLTSRIFVMRPLLDVAPGLTLSDGRRLADILEPDSTPCSIADDGQNRERNSNQHSENIVGDTGAAASRAQAIRRVEPHELLI